MDNNYDIKSIMEEIEMGLISSMKRTLWSHKKDEEVKGFDWPQWQALKIKQFEDYKKSNTEIFNNKSEGLNKRVIKQLKDQFKEGASRTNKEALINGYIKKEDSQLGGSFFGLNHRKLDALIKTVDGDLKDVKVATLRMANDKYRQIMYKAQVYANTGAKTVTQAIDMATKDFLMNGFNCIEYKNGARHNIADYCDMSIKTANKRANLMGEGEMRKKIGNPIVYISKHSTSCPLCLPWQDRVYIDDVWSGGTEEDGKYPLLSTAVAGGLFHPRCRHGASTYYEDVNVEPEPVKEAKKNSDENGRIQYLQRKKKQFDRLASGSLFPANIQKYQDKSVELQNQIENDRIQDINDCQRIIEKQGIKFDKESFAKIDEQLLIENTKQFNDLINKYPFMKEFVKNKNITFLAETLAPNTIGSCGHSYDMSTIKISLSKKFFKNYDELEKMSIEGINNFTKMPADESKAILYTLNHEIGHFIENILIDKFNKENVALYSNMVNKLKHANSTTSIRNIIRNYETNITDNISAEIYEIAQKNNNKFNIADNLSKYGKESSQEFFAECFANLESGKPNELGNAMKEYLEKRLK